MSWYIGEIAWPTPGFDFQIHQKCQPLVLFSEPNVFHYISFDTSRQLCWETDGSANTFVGNAFNERVTSS